MSNNDVVLRFSYLTGTKSDLRTFKIYRARTEGGSEEIELYKFHHPVTGLIIGVTTFYRQNLNTRVFETAGEIEWLSNSNGTVHFGIDEVSIRDLRKPKKLSSKSRRFKAAGSEYKWKMADNRVDLYVSNGKSSANSAFMAVPVC